MAIRHDVIIADEQLCVVPTEADILQMEEGLGCQRVVPELDDEHEEADENAEVGNDR
jgi:hypothetical protein